MPSSQKIRSFALTALKFLVAGGLIAWVFSRGALDWNALKIALSPVPFLLLGGLALVQVLVVTWRWRFLLKGQEFPVSFRESLELTLIGMFFNYAMPGSVGGDIIKGYYLARGQEQGSRKVAAGVSVFMDRLIGFFVMMFSASLAIVAFYDRLSHDPRLLAIGSATLLITLGFFAVLAFALSRRLQAPLRFFSELIHKLPGHAVLESIYHAMHSYRRHPRDLFIAMGLSMVNQVLLIIFFYATAQYLGEGNIPLSVFWFCIPMGLVIQAVPIAPAGVGIGQAAFFFLFQTALQAPTQVGAVGITLLQAFQFLLGLVGAVIYLRRGRVEIPSESAG